MHHILRACDRPAHIHSYMIGLTWLSMTLMLSRCDITATVRPNDPAAELKLKCQLISHSALHLNREVFSKRPFLNMTPFPSYVCVCARTLLCKEATPHPGATCCFLGLSQSHTPQKWFNFCIPGTLWQPPNPRHLNVVNRLAELGAVVDCAGGHGVDGSDACLGIARGTLMSQTNWWSLVLSPSAAFGGDGCCAD